MPPGRSALVALIVLAAAPARGLPAGRQEQERRKEDGGARPIVRAVRLVEPLQVDGRLDDSIYRTAAPVSGLIQQVPREGAPSTEKTEVWVLFDARAIYVAARCWDSAPPDKWVANELRRDTTQLKQNDTFGVAFDTFFDRRNGFVLYTNPLGARADYAVIDEVANFDWNPVWDVRTGRFEQGWTVEMEVPFKSLRYKTGNSQTWGVQFRRTIRRNNEWTYLTRVSARAAGPAGLTRVSYGGTLLGLDLPAAKGHLELKPFAIERLSTDRTAVPVVSNDPDGDFGVDVKYGVTPNLTADFTYNTDFAQVEVDEQQVNLTRFSIRLPEKREFFLEGRGLFEFGRPPGAAGSGYGSRAPAIVPSVFFSRRIGVERGRPVPVLFGERLTGKAGRFGLGVLNIQTRDNPAVEARATNFTVLRLKRDVLRQSSVGAIYTNRSNSAVAGRGANQTFGVDAAFTLRQNLTFAGWAARTSTPGLDGRDGSYQALAVYDDDRYGAQVDHLTVGRHFNPEIGYLQRSDFRRSFASVRFSPRPRAFDWIRKLTWEGSLEYIVTGEGLLDTRQVQAQFSTEFESSDQLSLEASARYELVPDPFPLARGVAVGPGAYQFNTVLASYQFGTQRRASGTVSVQRGGFYGGTLTALSVSSGQVVLNRHLSLEPGVSINRIVLPEGRATSTLLLTRANYAFTPRVFAAALLQYHSGENRFSTNVRLRWEYRPGSELFLVYTDDRDTSRAASPVALRTRAYVVKINRLFRF